jgi:hypothetical protein
MIRNALLLQVGCGLVTTLVISWAVSQVGSTLVIDAFKRLRRHDLIRNYKAAEITFYEGRTGSSEHSKITKNWAGISLTAVIRPLAASSLSNMNTKSAHAHLLRSLHALRENVCHRHVVWSTCCH